MKTTMTIRYDGAKVWVTTDGKRQYHREDGPAVIYPNGKKEWYLNGKLHRENGPAVIWVNGKKEYWINGNVHREDGPAVIYPNGIKEYWINSKLHREDGPAVIYPNGRQIWYLNGKCHREDGPAVIDPGNIEEYWVNGEKLTKEEFLKRTQPGELLTNNDEQKSLLNQQLNDEFKEIIATISAQQTAISLAEVKKFKRKLEKRNEEIKLSLRELEMFTFSRSLTPLIVIIMVFILLLSGLLASYLL